MKSSYLFLLFIVLLFTQNLLAQDEFTLVKPGDEAPDFTYEIKEGVSTQLSDLHGKVVWINFFATWCGPCRKELPHLEKDVFKKFRNREDFEVLVIGREHSWEEVNKFKSDNKYILPFYPDKDRSIFSKYAKQNIPRNFIIDKTGKIAVVSTGFEEKEFKKIIKKTKDLLK